MRKIFLGLSFILIPSLLQASTQETLKKAEAAPLTIDSLKGVHCDREKNFCSAEGKVVVRKGPYEIFTHKAKAFIRKNTLGKTEIFRIEAKGDVRFFGPGGESGTSDEATYDIEDGLVKLTPSTGNKVILWKDQYILEADCINIHFEKDKASLQKIDAIGKVLLSSPEEIIEGSKAVFTPDNHMIVVTGDVRVTNASGQLRGSCAKVNVDTKRSEVLKRPQVSKDRRARVLIYPKEVKKTPLEKNSKTS